MNIIRKKLKKTLSSLKRKGKKEILAQKIGRKRAYVIIKMRDIAEDDFIDADRKDDKTGKKIAKEKIEILDYILNYGKSNSNR